MSEILSEDFLTLIRELLPLTSKDDKKISDLFQKIVSLLCKDITSHLEIEPVGNQVAFTSGKVDKINRVDFGIKRKADKVILAKWLFDLPKMEKESFLIFITVKESFMQFFEFNEVFQEANEAIINIVTVLYLKELFNIRSFDNRIIASVRSSIYPNDIAGKATIYWDTLLFLLFLNNISYEDVMKSYLSIYSNFYNTQRDLDEFVDSFSNWVSNKTVKTQEAIAPIFLTRKLFTIVDLLHSLGYEDGTSSTIAKKMGVHQNTIRNAFGELLRYFSTFWQPILNLDKINLHNYLLKIDLKDNTNFDKIVAELHNIPYIKSIYRGEDRDGNVIIYSPNVISPHYVSDQINERLQFWERKNLIENSYLQLIRSKKRFGTLTTKPFDASIKNYTEFLSGKKNEDIKKYVFSLEEKDFSMEFESETPTFDYNILYFLSILKNKFLLKARYGVMVSELDKLFKQNDIDPTDVKTQTDFLNQIEIRARRRGLLTYSLYISSFLKGPGGVLLMEVPTETTDEPAFKQLVDQIRIFSTLGQFTLYDRSLLILPGLQNDHEIAQLIFETFSKNGFDMKQYSIRRSRNKIISYHELYDFDEQSWFLGLKK